MWGGLPIDAKITSLRKIQWQAIVPNSFLVLSPGPIQQAPAMFIASVRLAEKSRRYRLQEEIVRRFPNINIVDITEAAGNIRLILERISLVINFLTGLTVLNGVIILAGAIAAGRFARLRESMLLKVLGAQRSLIRKILISEYSLLALLGAFTGWLLAEVVNRPLLSLSSFRWRRLFLTRKSPF